MRTELGKEVSQSKGGEAKGARSREEPSRGRTSLLFVCFCTCCGPLCSCVCWMEVVFLLCFGNGEIYIKTGDSHFGKPQGTDLVPT